MSDNALPTSLTASLRKGEGSTQATAGNASVKSTELVLIGSKNQPAQFAEVHLIGFNNFWHNTSNGHMPIPDSIWMGVDSVEVRVPAWGHCKLAKAIVADAKGLIRVPYTLEPWPRHIDLGGVLKQYRKYMPDNLSFTPYDQHIVFRQQIWAGSRLAALLDLGGVARVAGYKGHLYKSLFMVQDGRWFRLPEYRSVIPFELGQAQQSFVTILDPLHNLLLASDKLFYWNPPKKYFRNLSVF
ncbi:MAG: hypothetical protein QM786_02765 [Breznakibacter sp.]